MSGLLRFCKNNFNCEWATRRLNLLKGGGGHWNSEFTCAGQIWTKSCAPARDTAETSRVCCSRGRNPSRRCAGRSRAIASRAEATGRRRNCTQYDYNHSLRVDLGQKDQIARTCTRHSQGEPRRAEFAARAAVIRADDVRVVNVRVCPARGRLGGGGSTRSAISTTHYVLIWGKTQPNRAQLHKTQPRRARDEPSLLLARPKAEPPACVSFTCVCVPRGQLGGGGAPPLPPRPLARAIVFSLVCPLVSLRTQRSGRCTRFSRVLPQIDTKRVVEIVLSVAPPPPSRPRAGHTRT